MPPARKLGQVIGAHQPDESGARETALKGPQRVVRVTCAKIGFQSGGDDPASICELPGGVQPVSKGGHPAARFERVAGRHQQPELVQPQMFDGLLRDMQVPHMGRIEGTSEQADFYPVAVAIGG